MNIPKIAISIPLVLMITACASLTPEEDMAIAADQVEQIKASTPLVSDPEVLAYVDALATQLLAGQPAPDGHDIKVWVVDVDDFNAFAIGGGNVYLTAGTIKASYNVAELASILAHELAHVLHGDPRESYRPYNTSETLANLAGVVLAVATANPFLIGAGSMASDFGTSTYINTHTRAQERAADELAFKLMVDAGYDPRSQLTVFTRLEIYGGNRDAVPAFLQSHPIPEERIENTKARLSSMPAGLRLRVGDDGGLENIKSRLLNKPQTDTSK